MVREKLDKISLVYPDALTEGQCGRLHSSLSEISKIKSVKKVVGLADLPFLALSWPNTSV